MKHIIAIFSVILTLGMVVPTNLYAADACKPQACSGGTLSFGADVLHITTSGGGLCFGCEYGDDDHECDEGAIVGQRDTMGHLKSLHLCRVGRTYQAWEWEDVSSSYGFCSATDIRPSSFDGDNYECMYSLDGRTTDYSSLVASLPSGGMPCKICKCKPGYIKNSMGTDCELDTSAQKACTNSNGQWDAANSRCLCGNDRTDSKGGGQIYDTPDKSCKCKDDWSWDETKGECLAPDAADVEACEESKGEWNNGECTCNETTLTQSTDKKTCVKNQAYYDCTGSGGKYSDKKCTCSESKGFQPTPVDGRCECSDTQAVYDKTQDKCMKTPEAICTNSGGIWKNNECTCDAKKNVTEVSGSDPTRCDCKDEDYDWESDKSQGCKLKDEAAKRIDAYNALKKSCEENWGMTFEPAEYDRKYERKDWKCNCSSKDGLIPVNKDNLSCTCDTEHGYVLDSAIPPYKCRLTDYQKDETNCKSAPNYGVLVKWVDKGVIGGRKVGECQCLEPNKQYNYATKTCLDNNVTQMWCNTIPGAQIARDGSCLCLATEQPPVNYKCPTAGGAAPSASSPISADKLAAATKNQTAIIDISKKLKEISDSFGRSHWKTASGNFNGARLASDSIAGVVLGTVGGVVTSNIIKKNQVRGGFENIGCTVGGQMVADWGDQFQVGIR